MAQRAATKDIPMCKPPPLDYSVHFIKNSKLSSITINFTHIGSHIHEPVEPYCQVWDPWTWLSTINQPPLHTIQKAPESPLEMARADSGLLCLLHQYKGGLPLQNSASTNQPKLRSQLSDIINSSRKKTKCFIVSVRHPIHVKIERVWPKIANHRVEKYIEKEIEIISKSGKSTHLQVYLCRDWSSFANSKMFRLLLVLLACTRSYQVSRTE